MKVLLLGLNYAPEPIGIGPYTAGLVEALSAEGHEVRVVAGHPYYPDWKACPGHHLWQCETQGRKRIWRVPHFIPRQPSGLKRLFHQLTFALSALPILAAESLVWRPDCVIAIAPSLAASPLALFAARLAGARTWLHVQDFEFEAALATGLIDSHPIFDRALRTIESTILRSFDRVSTISPAMCRRLADKGVPHDRISEQRNWGNIGEIVPIDRPSPYRAEWEIKTPHVALYSGALGRKQGLETVIEAARTLVPRQDLTFVICGNGPDRDRLQALAAGLPNIRFCDLQPAGQLGEFLNLAIIHLLPQIAGAADLVLPSKLPNMLASGRPVIATAAPGTGLFDEVRDCGLLVEPGDAAALARAIGQLCDDPALRIRLGRAARHRAELRWQRAAILSGFVAAIEALAQSRDARPVLAGEKA